MLDQNQILLQTKLHRPRLPQNLLHRSRLMELLDQATVQQIVLVCAPAGFGKTILVGTWLERLAGNEWGRAGSMPSAWLSLDEDDSELYLFLRYFIAALRTIFPEACEQTLALLHGRQQPPQAAIYATLSNELARLPGEAILVLDDYHALRGADVHNLLGELIRHWPRQLHLVLISRVSPPIPLHGLRAKGMVGEIRARDLRFTPDETSAYLSRSRFALLGPSARPLLEERFEGWPAGLHLAALSLRSEGSQESVLHALSSENPNITGYLMDEVMAHQIPAIHSFLLKTSILNRFCAPLCEVIVGETEAEWNARACLNWIERSELFITPLDDQREWYRYHQLFQELLQQRLSAGMGPDQVSDLHRRASAWFAEHGLLDEALHHALAAGDLDLAARQMVAGLRDVLNREDRQTLERWLRLLPEEMIEQHPELLMLSAWVSQFTWRLDLQSKVIRQVEALLDSGVGASLSVQDPQILRGQILLVKAEHAYFSNQVALAIDLCRQVLALLPPAWTFVRGGAMLFLGMSMQASGQALDAERLLLAEYESSGNKTDIYGLFLLQSLGFTYLNTGQLERARQIAELLLQGATLSRITIMKNWADWFLGLVHYQRNELDSAAAHFARIVENRYTAQMAAYRDAAAGLALIHQIRGDRSEASRMIESLSQFDLEQRGVEDDRTRSLRARLMLLQGDLDGTSNWLDTLTGPPPDRPLIWLEEPQVTRARVLVARGADGDLEAALQVLGVLDEIAERTHSASFTIETLALRALALEAQGDNSQADAALKQAVDLARPGGFIRVFLDLGRPMQGLLDRLAKQGHSSEMITRMLAAFPVEQKHPLDSASPASASVLVERLTPRELEVLTLLRGPLNIKEIALQLNISHATAKRHTINIYAKLGVNQRWSAVAKAEELGLLPPR